MLFRSCGTLDVCEDCFSEDINCVFCNAPIEGLLADNLVRIVDDVTEAACEAECTIEERCQGPD